MSWRIINKKDKIDFMKSVIIANAKISYGGTSSGIIALASAKAASLLKSKVFYTTVFVSPLIYINSAHIGVPGLGRCGLKQMVAAGLVSKKPELGLHVLSSLTDKDIQKVKELSKDTTLINVEVQYNIDPIYCRVIAVDDQANTVDIKIEYDPTYFSSIKVNAKETLDALRAEKQMHKIGFETWDQLLDWVSIKDAYEIVKKLTIDELSFLDEHIKVNKAICDEGLKHPEKDSIHYHYVRALDNLKNSSIDFYEEGWMHQLCINITAGIDARMNGSPRPAMTSATNGDHGIVAVMVPYYYGKYFDIPKVKIYQAIFLSHFITWRISEKIGKLTVMCGTAIAAIAGAITAIAYMKNEKWEIVQNFLNMHLCQQAGTLCFGSSPSCCLKILSSLIAGFYCLQYCELGGKVPHLDGIVHQDVEHTLNNLKRYTDATNAVAVQPIVEKYQEANAKGK